MKVLKFGGTSVGSTDAMRAVAQILLKYKKSRQKFTVVFSAMGGVTNLLLEAGNKASNSDSSYLDTVKLIEEKHITTIQSLMNVKNQSSLIAYMKTLMNELEDLLQGIFLLKELSPRTSDLLVSFGERLSNQIMASLLVQEGLKAEMVDARELIKTDDNFSNAKVNFSKTDKNIQAHFKKSKSISVVTGFIASTDKGETTTLGRGGSDYTAAIIASALKADMIEIWTDVDGVMTADPKKVKQAFTLSEISYVEAMEISHFGAKVIYPPTLQPAFNKKIPIVIKNTFNPDHNGTLITDKSKNEKYPVKGVTSMENITLVTLQGSGLMGVTGVSARLFGALSKEKINIILITQASSEYSICLAVDAKDAKKAKTAIDEEFANEIKAKKIDPVLLKDQLAIIAIVGENMKQTPGISGKMFSSLGKNAVNVVAIAQGSSEFNLSVVIDKADLNKALNSLHEAFFLSDVTNINVFVVGLGLIGGTLINQIQKQAENLLVKKHIKINVVGIANSKKMMFKEAGLSLNNVIAKLNEKGENIDLKEFVSRIKEMNLQNSIFVDNTSSKDVVDLYEVLLENRISIVTPNKLASSESLAKYKKLHEIAFNKSVKFLYETNVGAGLPVINTLQDLIYSGDSILKIEGVLSGTLSYIFNNFKGDVSFSDVVKVAQEKGFTEPDPRDDLNGKDVARKILILSREAGYDLEPKDVKVENILPAACVKAKTVAEFFKQLEAHNDVFAKRRSDAEKKGKTLRFIAKMEKGKATVSLEAVSSDHPFYALDGSDNIIAYTTDRYLDRPLVIKGPGAGAEVTAAGVFADIIRISNYLKG